MAIRDGPEFRLTYSTVRNFWPSRLLSVLRQARMEYWHMPFGIDTFRSHLDLLPAIFPGGDFFASNGGARPVFAGRNFLGGDFLWGHGEATNALQDPSPTALGDLVLSVPLVAPVQAPLSARQQMTGPLGHLYGQIDGDAICKRLQASINSGEFNLPPQTLVHVWLSVAPAFPFSADYWAGWADQVNNFPISAGAGNAQPFRAGINCNFSIGVTGKLEPGAQVLAAITSHASKYRGSQTTCYALWADTAANPPLDWSAFSGTTMPLIWRFSHGFRDDAGVIVSNLFDVDDTNPMAGAQKATDFMLVAQQWQPSLGGVMSLGFSSRENLAAQATCLSTAVVPKQSRIETCGQFTMEKGNVYAIGRYIGEDASESIGAAEASVISGKSSLHLFTVFERHFAVSGGVGGATSKSYYDPANEMGKKDAAIAFKYCAEVLQQPPHTHVFFAIDWTPPGVPTSNDQEWIQKYVELIKEGHDAYLTIHPNRPYLIGIYGSGAPLRWSYEKGAASGFWQAGSMCQNESAPPRWPWPHATRWQYMVSPPSQPMICGIPGEDLDADWGDGGTWTLTDPLARELARQELREPFFGQLPPFLINLLP